MRGFAVRGRSFQALQRFLRRGCLRTARQNLEIVLVLDPSFVGLFQLFQAFGQAKRGRGIVLFVEQSLAIAVLRRAIVLALEIKIPDFNVFRRLVWIPKMRLTDVGSRQDLRILYHSFTLWM